MRDINAQAIVDLQGKLTADWHNIEPAVTAEGFWGVVEANHRFNFLLWHEEDQARRDDLGAEHVYKAKRAIDGYNQNRNDCMQQMDQALIAQLKPAPQDTCPLNSETPGMMIDRLSILSLKAYHMQEQVDRDDVDEAHRERCREKVRVIQLQIADLSGCLQALLDAVKANTRTFKVYFQFKMYNDATLNPQLYQNAGDTDS